MISVIGVRGAVRGKPSGLARRVAFFWNNDLSVHSAGNHVGPSGLFEPARLYSPDVQFHGLQPIVDVQEAVVFI